MITSTMTALEISNLVDKDRERIQKYLGYQFKSMAREMRKGFKKEASKIIDYSTPNAKYKIILYVSGKFNTFSLLALNYESNEWIDVTFSSSKYEGKLQYAARSVHFFNRYAERYLLVKDMPLDKIILSFYRAINCAVVIYWKGDRVVFSSSNGLFLATYDEQKLIIHVATYVSAEMLKRSQFSAWLKVWAISQRMNKISLREIKEGGRLTPTSIERLDFTDKEKLTINEATEIYSTFFKHYEDD